MMILTDVQRQRAVEWLPAVTAGGIAWLAFLLIGDTPLVRASGMALAIIGMTLALRSMGAMLAIIGGLALAFSPAFWIQTGGAESLEPLEVGLSLVAALIVGGLALRFSSRPFVGIALVLLVFAGLFLGVVGTPRSLRLTTLLTAWLLFLLVDGLIVSNPRPDDTTGGQIRPYHTYGILILLFVGVLNDPLFTLLVPAIALGLFLSNQKLARLFWLALLAIAAFGIYGVLDIYYSPYWWHYPTDEAIARDLRHIPYLLADGWQEPRRWIGLFELIVGQFTIAGLALGILGLARLSRWYPPVGVVTMIAFGTYAVFGLIYFGGDRPVLLLPLLMIQVLWMTYAVYTFGQWLQKSLHWSNERVRLLAAAAFTLLPLFMLLRIVGAV